MSESQIDRIKCTINVGISDNNYNALIKNKVKQVYFLDQTRASDNSTITAASSTNVTFHVVVGGASSAAASVCYSVFESLQYLVSAMTNGAVLFASDFFDTGGEQENLMLCTGQEISAPSVAANLAPGISFEDTYKDLKVLYNLRQWVEESGGVYTLRVEPFEYFRATETSVGLSDLNELTENVTSEKLYSNIKCGSNGYRKPSTSPATTFQNTTFQTWAKETYNVRGDCVTDNSLQLSVSSLIIDSNSIEAQEAADKNKDDDVFLVETDGTNTLQFDFLGDGNLYYNAGLTNQSVSSRWSDRIHNQAFSDAGNTNGDFSARPTADQPGFINGMAAIIKFNTEISDPDTAYDPATLSGVYTAPANGLYLFEVQGRFEVTYSTAEGAFIDWAVELSVNLTDYVETRRVPLASFPGGTISYDLTQVIAVTLIIGDTVVVAQDFQNANFPITPDTGTAINYLDTSRFTIESLLVGSSVPIQYKTNYPLTPEQYDAILANRDYQLDLDGYSGWVKDVNYTPFGISEITVEAVKT